MKEYDLTCDCGHVTRIPATDAGQKKTCACGKEFEVPSLGQLRAAVNERPEPIRTESAPPSEFSAGWIGAAVVIFGPILAAIVKLTMMQSGQFYLEDALVLSMLQALSGIVGCAIFAKSKGLPIWLGGAIGIIGCIGLLILFFMPVNESAQMTRGPRER